MAKPVGQTGLPQHGHVSISRIRTLVSAI